MGKAGDSNDATRATDLRSAARVGKYEHAHVESHPVCTFEKIYTPVGLDNGAGASRRKRYSNQRRTHAFG